MNAATVERPLASFLLFAYNQERFIREAVEGALAQTYSPLEIILSDDCSTDGTFPLMKSIAERYHGPHTILLNRNETNLGLGGHWNRAVALSHGRWIIPAAGDDVSLPERVHVLMHQASSQKNVMGLCSWWHFVDDVGRPMNWELRYLAAESKIHRTRFAELEQIILGRHPVLTGCSAAWNRDLFTRFAAFPNSLLMEDIVLTIRALTLGDVLYLQEKLLNYRIHSTNLSMRNTLRPKDTLAEYEQEENRTLRWYRGLQIAYAAGKADIEAQLADCSLGHHRSQLDHLLSLLKQREADLEQVASWWNITPISRARLLLKAVLAPSRNLPWRFMIRRFFSYKASLQLRSIRDRFVTRNRVRI